MLHKILNYFRRPEPCICHDAERGISLKMPFGSFTVKSKRLAGATLSWGGSVVPYEVSTIECNWCHREFERGGYLPNKFWEEKYPLDENGWPTVDGKQMEIAQL